MSSFSRLKKMKDCLINTEPSPAPAIAKVLPVNSHNDIVTDIGVMRYMGSGEGKSDFEQVLDANGNPVLDEDNHPVFKKKT